MKNIKSECPHCNGSIEFPEDKLFETVECPHCKEPIQLIRTPVKMQIPISIMVIICVAMSLVEIVLAFSSEMSRLKIQASNLSNPGTLFSILAMAVAPVPFLFLIAAIGSLFARKENRKRVLVGIYLVLVILTVLAVCA